LPAGRLQVAGAFLTPVNAIPGRRVPSVRDRARAKTSIRPGTQIRVASSDSRTIHQQQEILMRSKLAISALVVASMLEATAIASAQTQPAQPAPGASSEGNVGPGATTNSKMKSGKMKTSKMKSGTTTGMSSGSSKSDSAPKNGDSK